MAWDVSIISTFKEVIAGINWLDVPAGILLFGADSDFKDQVHEKFLNNIIGIVEIDVSDLPQADSIGTASAPNGWNTLVVLTGDDSTDHAKRHHTVEALKRMGAKQKPFYRIVASDSRNRRDSGEIEVVGTYDVTKNPAIVAIDREKAIKWLKNGAVPTDTVRNLFQAEGIMKEYADSKKAAK